MGHFRCLKGLNLNWSNSYDTKYKHFHFPFFQFYNSLESTWQKIEQFYFYFFLKKYCLFSVGVNVNFDFEVSLAQVCYRIKTVSKSKLHLTHKPPLFLMHSDTAGYFDFETVFNVLQTTSVRKGEISYLTNV